MDETQRRVWRFEAPRSRRHHELQLQSLLLLEESLSNEHTSPPPLIHLDKVEGMKGCFRLVHRGIVTQKNARLRIPPLPNAISELLSLPPQLPRCDPR